jgi:two-component system chemotaxis response regulator CheB
MIKVLLVDDSPLALTILKRMLAKAPEIEVVGTAVNGREALLRIPQLRPDVICTDLHMPVMDGLELTKEVMARHPLPILLVSVSAQAGSVNAFNVIEAGAIDLVLKPRADLELDDERVALELVTKIKILAGVHVFGRARADAAAKPGRPERGTVRAMRLPQAAVRIIVIGASTGGPHALQVILTRLPASFPVPIICIQHISTGFLQGLVEWLDPQCRMKVEVAKAGAAPRAGTIYFAEEESHLRMDAGGKFLLTAEPPHGDHRPSVDVTMKAIAAHYGNAACGVLLTGMGKDGAEGLLAIRMAGGMTIAQDEATSIVFGMPKQAIALDAAGYIAPLNEIGPMIVNFTMHLLQRKSGI